MFGFIKKAAKGLGGIVKKAIKVATLPARLVYKGAEAAIKGAEWIKAKAEEYKAQGYSQSEAERRSVEDAKKAGGFPWLYVGIGAGVLVIIVIVIILITRKR